MLIYMAATIIAVVLFWLNQLPSPVMLGIIMLSGLLSYLERCPNCRTSYLMQEGKSILKLGTTCENCGAPIP
jgi:uncharacterized protein (DUF983 family)